MSCSQVVKTKQKVVSTIFIISRRTLKTSRSHVIEEVFVRFSISYWKHSSPIHSSLVIAQVMCRTCTGSLWPRPFTEPWGVTLCHLLITVFQLWSNTVMIFWMFQMIKWCFHEVGWRSDKDFTSFKKDTLKICCYLNNLILFACGSTA